MEEAIGTELRDAQGRLADYLAHGDNGLPAKHEAVLFHELAAAPRTFPFLRTTRRKPVAAIAFPEGVEVEVTAHCFRPVKLITAEMRERVSSFAFSPLGMDVQDLMLSFFVMFQELDLLAKFEIDPRKLQELFRILYNGYRDNCYHNFCHAMDVAQLAFAMHQSSDRLQALLGDQELLALLLLTIAHDIDHPGVNNDFLVRTHDPIALLYNDDSVLENSHSSCLFMILKNHATANILSGLEAGQWSHVRSLILRGIRATDMSKHGALLGAFSSAEVLEPADKTDAYVGVLIQMVAKCSDLAHLVRPWATAKAWEERVQEEFFQQGDLEKSLGMVPSGLMDREKCNVAGSQLWFYQNMGRPLYEALVRHLPRLQPLLSQMMDTNFKEWGKIKAAAPC